MMTLEETINRYERQTEELYKAIPCDGCAFDKCKEEHRQLAEWLKELKAYRKAKTRIIENMKAWEKIYNEPLEWNVEDINSIKLAFYQDGKADAYTDCIGICEIAFEEVNADGKTEDT